MLKVVDTIDSQHRNLILIGFMGTGKTTVGKKVARSLGFRFVDTDRLISRRAGKTIPRIFAEDGEEAFRRLETEVLLEYSTGSGQVISTGGGIVTREENFPILHTAGYVIWLKTSAETIYARVNKSRNRPLLRTPDPRKTIADMLEERSPLYAQAADFTISTDGLTLEETCFGVTESARLAIGAM